MLSSPARPTPIPQDDSDDESDIELTDNFRDQPDGFRDQEDSEILGEDFDEATGLMSSRYSLEDEYDLEDRSYHGSFRNLVCLMMVVLIIATLAVVIPETGSLWYLKSPARIPVNYNCPIPVAEDGNLTAKIAANATDFLQEYRERTKDRWDRTYDELKASMFDFKSKYFPKYLNDDGSSIYESGCGVGITLFMTLEILQESSKIDNLVVYGSDQKEDFVRETEAVLDKLGPAHSDKGVFCVADPTDLGFVPENSFDLVYTGYIRPLKDPLNIGGNQTDNHAKYLEMCDAVDWKGLKLKELAQETQEEWYGQNVREMARLAKPGSPVIVEQVSKRNCDSEFDRGGVAEEWWTESARNNTYGWNVNPDSIVIEVATLYVDRYHVFMLKNGQKPE